MIKEKLQHRKLLVIIDDVDKVEQLEALARSHDWFGPGSRIDITRDEQLLKPCVDDIYVAEEMDEEEALELFIWHAFKGCHVNEEYVELSRRVVSYCRGLPLALKVLVSSLATQSKEVWESQLDKLNTIPPEDVVNKMFTKLKFINLSHSHDLAKSPDFSKLPNLEELILEDCKSLPEVQSSIGDLQRLTLVNLEDCEMLTHLPLNFYNSKSIKTLLLNGCSRFQNLADGLGDMV
ncbi:PREDICTED: probable disease resistance protein RPP1 [Prunus mume]|uniref:Probable disease resistance protein RPP1 n=1 Tax=Prunus mume TaxID=102107 RepID=A0ABM1LHD8_PRUMU|nr:PREDICTED: probable disease resistance protein RPP1 [Prunus mume]